MIVSNAIDCFDRLTALIYIYIYIYLYSGMHKGGGWDGLDIYIYIYISKRENRSILKQMIKS